MDFPVKRPQMKITDVKMAKKSESPTVQGTNC